MEGPSRGGREKQRQHACSGWERTADKANDVQEAGLVPVTLGLLRTNSVSASKPSTFDTSVIMGVHGIITLCFAGRGVYTSRRLVASPG